MLGDILARSIDSRSFRKPLLIQIYFYWISTALLCLLYLASATMYIAKRDVVRQALTDLGYPGYLRPILIVAKILAVAAVASRLSVALSDLAYAGMLFHLLLAVSAHLHERKPSAAVPAAVGVVLLIASFATQNAVREPVSPYAPATAVQRASLS
jgi:hypothetical protein